MESRDVIGGAESDPRWSSFLHSLQESGYFGKELEGSMKHNEKMAAAREYFMNLHQDGGDLDEE